MQTSLTTPIPLPGVEFHVASGLPMAVCLLLWNSDDKTLLCASRRHKEIYGLVGGKVDLGETPEEAVVRETGEETGVVVDLEDLMLIYEGVCEKEDPNGRDFWTITYMVKAKPHHIARVVEEGIVPAWLTWDELHAQGAFGDYNRAVQVAFEARGF